MANVIDSSVWVALFLDFDTQHTKAARAIDKLIGTIYLPYCVILEVTAILTYKHSKKLANNFLSYIQDNRDIEIINNDVFEEMDFYLALSQRISFVDASLIFLAQKLNARLVTFDKQLERIAKRFA